MIDYSLTLCYGIIVPDSKMKEFKEALTGEEYNEMIDNYCGCIDNWLNDNYFIGVMTECPESEIESVYRISEFTIPSDDDENLIDFKCFFSEHDLWKFIDWKPELLLINFSF